MNLHYIVVCEGNLILEFESPSVAFILGEKEGRTVLQYNPHIGCWMYSWFNWGTMSWEFDIS